jgi:hypothetical protein
MGWAMRLMGTRRVIRRRTADEPRELSRENQASPLTPPEQDIATILREACKADQGPQWPKAWSSLNRPIDNKESSQYVTLSVSPFFAIACGNSAAIRESTLSPAIAAYLPPAEISLFGHFPDFNSPSAASGIGPLKGEKLENDSFILVLCMLFRPGECGRVSAVDENEPRL